MTKSTITRTWFAGLGLFAAGAIVCATALAFILGYTGSFISISNGVQFSPRIDGFFWTLVSVCAVGCIAALVGFVVEITAWIGALVNTNKLADKTWFGVLLVTGVLAFTCALAPVAFAGMAAYLIYGPDGTKDQGDEIKSPAGRPAAVAPAS
jgi:hypothetical protein